MLHRFYRAAWNADAVLRGGAENAGVENAGVEKAGVDSRGGKCRSGKYRSENVWRAVKAENILYH